MPDAAYSNTVLTEPVDRPLNEWRGAAVTPSRLIDMWTRNWELSKWDKTNVKRARDFRRLDLRTRLDPDFLKDHPELSWVVSIMSERATLEREQIARVTSVLPQLSREALGDRDLDDRNAEQYERYMQDWTSQYVPRKEFGRKGVEDGSYGVVVLPSELDMSGEPDFYNRLDQRTYDMLDAEQQAGYTRDPHDPKGRYAKLDAQGKKLPHPQWDRSASGQTAAEAKKAGKPFARDEAKSQQAHDDARDRYLLTQQAVSVRLVPALDCIPIWGRGTGLERFELVGLLERSLMSVEDCLAADYGWLGMGNRRLIPRGYGDTRTTGINGEYYVYTLYCTVKDGQGCLRPTLYTTVGGYGSWSTSPRYPSGAPGAKDSVAKIDLYDTHRLTGPFWGFYGGMQTGDDDPYHRFQPWMFPFIDQILSIEGTTTAIKAATALNAYTGYNYKPDAAIAAADDEAVVETALTGQRRLRAPVLAKAGRIVTNAGDITPQITATVSPDAWRLNADEKASLLQNTSTQRPDASSGNALVESETIAAVNQTEVRDGVAQATKFCAERAAVIFDAFATNPKFLIPWPLATTQKPATGSEQQQTAKRPAREVSTFDSEWLGDEKNVKLVCDFPDEENLARIDLERSLKKDRLASFADVQKARGKSDAFAVRVEIAEDDLWDMPENIALFNQRVAEISGNRKLLKILRLKQAQQMQDGGVPGMAQGMPSSMLKRRQDVQTAQMVPSGGGGGGAPGIGTASDIRGGVQGAQMNAARGAQQVQAAATSAGTGQQGAA